MVYHHHTFRCPKCNQITERVTTVDSELLYGSPFRICPHCQYTYFNPEYKEKALVLVESKGGELTFSGFLWFVISNAGLLFFIYNTIALSKKEGFDSLMLLPIGLFAILSFLFDYGLIRMIRNHKHKAEFTKNQIDYIEGRTRERTPEVIESMERLSDRNYLDALKSRGISIHNYFYDRLNKYTAESIAQDAGVYSTQELQQPRKNASIAYCNKCGARITPDSVFCSKCGARIAH